MVPAIIQVAAMRKIPAIRFPSARIPVCSINVRSIPVRSMVRKSVKKVSRENMTDIFGGRLLMSVHHLIAKSPDSDNFKIRVILKAFPHAVGGDYQFE